MIEQLEPTTDVKRQRGLLHTELADVLTAQGEYTEARQRSESSLAIYRELNDQRGEGVTLGQLGGLAEREGNFTESLTRYREALALFQELGEPRSIAIAHHQLGIVHQSAQSWEAAERHYRESARIKEQLGDVPGAATTWHQLAMVCAATDRLQVAETWYRKAIAAYRRTGDPRRGSISLSNLAGLLVEQSGRIGEAGRSPKKHCPSRGLSTRSSEIWKTYDLLAYIAENESHPEDAAEYRRQARQSKRNFAGTRHELQRHLPVIVATLLALTVPDTVPPSTKH